MPRHFLAIVVMVCGARIVAQIPPMPPNRHCPLGFFAVHYYYDPNGDASSVPHHVGVQFDDTDRGGGLVTAIGVLHGPSASEEAVRSYPSREFIRMDEIGKDIQTFKISMDPKAHWHLRGGGPFTNYLKSAAWVEFVKFVFRNGSDWTPEGSGHPDAHCSSVVRQVVQPCKPGNRERNPFCTS